MITALCILGYLFIGGCFFTKIARTPSIGVIAPMFLVAWPVLGPLWLLALMRNR